MSKRSFRKTRHLPDVGATLMRTRNGQDPSFRYSAIVGQCAPGKDENAKHMARAQEVIADEARKREVKP